jgi:hypothetical protein
MSRSEIDVMGRRILDKGILCGNSRGTWEWTGNTAVCLKSRAETGELSEDTGRQTVGTVFESKQSVKVSNTAGLALRFIHYFNFKC